MGEKFSPEKLEAMRSVGFNKSGRIRHNQADVPVRVIKDTPEERITIDENNAVYTDKADGTQDLTLNPQPIRVDMKQTPTG